MGKNRLPITIAATVDHLAHSRFDCSGLHAGPSLSMTTTPHPPVESRNALFGSRWPAPRVHPAGSGGERKPADGPAPDAIRRAIRADHHQPNRISRMKPLRSEQIAAWKDPLNVVEFVVRWGARWTVAPAQIPVDAFAFSRNDAGEES